MSITRLLPLTILGIATASCDRSKSYDTENCDGVIEYLKNSELIQKNYGKKFIGYRTSYNVVPGFDANNQIYEKIESNAVMLIFIGDVGPIAMECSVRLDEMADLMSKHNMKVYRDLNN